MKILERYIGSFDAVNGDITPKFYLDIGSGLNLERVGLVNIREQVEEDGVDIALTVSFGRNR